MQHGGLGCESLPGCLNAGGVGDIDVVGAMAGHERVATDAVEHGMHDEPLVRGLAPSPLCLLWRETDHGPEAKVGMERTALDKDAAPDDGAGLADAFEGTSAQREVHDGLAF